MLDEFVDFLLNKIKVFLKIIGTLLFLRKNSVNFCRICGRNQYVSWEISEDLWIELIPEKNRNKNICLDCFGEIAARNKIILSQEDLLTLSFDYVIEEDIAKKVGASYEPAKGNVS